MKKFNILAVLFLSAVTLFGQDGYKKFVLLEHFTNTRCGICGNANPAFYTRWSAYPDDIHHISYHPSFPYSNCAIYQSNPTENSKRATFYNVPATPYVMKNGGSGSSAGSTSTSVLNGLVGGKSPVLVQVSESGTANRSGIVSVFSHPSAALPTGNLTLYVAAVEKEYLYNAPNGETVHHNVFRHMIVDGQPIQLAASAGKVEQNYAYTLDPSWNDNEMYVMAWVQNSTSKEVYNSGSSLDAQVLNTKLLNQSAVKIAPNPVTDAFTISFDEATKGNVQVFDLLGKAIQSITFENQIQWEVQTASMTKGVYLVRIQTPKGVLTRKVLVQ